MLSKKRSYSSHGLGHQLGQLVYLQLRSTLFQGVAEVVEAGVNPFCLVGFESGKLSSDILFPDFFSPFVFFFEFCFWRVAA